MFPFSYLVAIVFVLAVLATAPPLPASAATAGPSSPLRRGLYFKDEFLLGHNAARAAVGVPPLVWNVTLYLDATRYANELRSSCRKVPLAAWGTDGVYGRNIYRGAGLHTAADVVAEWVSERKWYDARTGRCTAPERKTCGEYTQMVSYATTQIGCGRRACVSGPGNDFGRGTIAICEYYPPANVKGKRPY